MPCMGPSQDAAYRQARELTEEILSLLRQHGVGYKGLDEPNHRFAFKDDLKVKLLEVIKEIAWDDACASF